MSAPSTDPNEQPTAWTPERIAKSFVLLVAIGVATVCAVYTSGILEGGDVSINGVILLVVLLGLAGYVYQHRKTDPNVSTNGPTSNQEEYDFVRRKVIQSFLGAVGFSLTLLGAASIICFPGTRSAAFRISCIWAFAYLAAGFLLGFLFGLSPAQLKADSASGNASSTTAPLSPSATQTGLEQIVEWVTKIIVGVGLVEFKTLCAGFMKAAVLMAKGISDNTVPAGDAVSFAGAVILLFSILGFLGGYLITKLYLFRAISYAGGVSGSKASVEIPPPPPAGFVAGLGGGAAAVLSANAAIRQYWRPGDKLDKSHEALLLAWLKNNLPGATITDLIYSSSLETPRQQVIKELNIPTGGEIPAEPRSIPPQSGQG